MKCNRRPGKVVVAAALLLALPVLWAQEPENKKPAPDKADANNRGQVQVVGASETKTNTSAAERNENVWVSKLDNDALKAEGSRLGIDVTIVSRPVVEKTYYAAEHGQPPADFPVSNRSKVSSWHGELFEAHRNSVFNARTFFQVGPVMPSRSNQYGARLSGPTLGIGNITVTLSQRQVGGAVNGNVHVPLLSERTPTATDPETRAIVSGFLAAYPATPPNLPELDERALNTNAVQVIHQTDAGLIFDREFSGKHQLHLDYSLNRQYIDAFQFVAGANPQNEA